MWLDLSVPALTTFDLTIVALVFGPALLLGVPLVKAAVKQPARCELEPVDPQTLSRAQTRWLRWLDERMTQIGFQPVATFRVANLGQRNLNRVFMSSADPAAGLATALTHEHEGTRLAQSYVEFCSEFADGTQVNSRSVKGSRLLAPPPRTIVFDHPWLPDPVALKARHDQHCQPHLVRGVVFPRPESFFDDFQEDWSHHMAHQVASGLLTPEQQGYHRPTTRLAIRGVADFFNPFGDTFTLARLAAALLAGLALPMAALWALRLPEITAVAQLADALSLSWSTGLTLALAPALLVAGGVLGWVFQGKSLIWCFLLPYLGARLALPGELPASAQVVFFLTALCAPIVAHHASNLRGRLQDLA
jgi:hypothetical protein